MDRPKVRLPALDSQMGAAVERGTGGCNDGVTCRKTWLYGEGVLKDTPYTADVFIPSLLALPFCVWPTTPSVHTTLGFHVDPPGSPAPAPGSLPGHFSSLRVSQVGWGTAEGLQALASLVPPCPGTGER